MRGRSSDRLVERDDAGAAQTQVVLQREARAFDLALSGLAAHLPHEFSALRQAGRAERMAFGEQAARRVGDDATAVRVVAVDDEALGRAWGREAQRFVG